MISVLFLKIFFWLARAMMSFTVIQTSHLLVPYLYAEALAVINNVFSKTFTVGWTAGWISPIILTYFIGL